MKENFGAKAFYIAFAALMFSLILIPVGSAAVGVEEGDWIEYNYTISSAEWPETYPTWIKVEFLSVGDVWLGTTTTVQVTMHMSDGTLQNQTMTVDIESGEGLGTFSGFVIPANCKAGDSIDTGYYGFITIDDESTRTYAGASRTVIYASFSDAGTELTYYWDKKTGVLVEASSTFGGMTATAKVTGTNIWEGGLLSGQSLWIFVVAIIIVVGVVAGSTFLLMRRRKAPLPETETIPTDACMNVEFCCLV